MIGAVAALVLALSPSWSTVAADLDPAAVRFDESAAPDPREILDAFVEAGAAYRFDVGRLTVWTDPRWYGIAAVAEEGSESPPLLEIRRWPGDTVLAFYALPAGSSPPPVPAAEWGELRESRGGWSLREIRIHGDGDPRKALWAERPVDGDRGRCGALLVAGDAGLGEGSSEIREAEMLAILARTETRDEAWRLAGAPPPAPLALPVLPSPPRNWDEGRDPWQTVEGPGFTLGLPPGIVARRLDPEFVVPSAVPDALLWFRGRLTDRDGQALSVGDGVRAGYVVEIPGDRRAWRGGGMEPRGCPGGVRKDMLALEKIAIVGTGARTAWVSSWSEPGFAGEWIVFALDFEEKGVEIGIPVLSGRRSLALFWIPVTWRGAARPPAPPPIDPASRFGIRFDRATRLERSRRGWIEGTLIVPGLRLELPRGWWPSATLRSTDGFPILLVDERGEVAGMIERLDRSTWDRERNSPGWTERKGARSRGATRWFEGEGGAHVLEAREGHAWRLVRADGDGPGWGRVVESVTVLRLPAP